MAKHFRLRGISLQGAMELIAPDGRELTADVLVKAAQSLNLGVSPGEARVAHAAMARLPTGVSRPIGYRELAAFVGGRGEKVLEREAKPLTGPKPLALPDRASILRVVATRCYQVGAGRPREKLVQGQSVKTGRIQSGDMI